MITKDSLPEIFWDPIAAGVRNPQSAAKRRPASDKRMQPVVPPNPARLADDMLHQFEAIPGFGDFLRDVSVLSSISGSPGWEDSSDPPKKTSPGAKPIGTAQWGAAIATAGMITDALLSPVPVRGIDTSKPWPVPGIDEAGFIWLNWRVGDAEFSLELHANLLHQSYRWRRVLDGVPRDHEAVNLSDVLGAPRLPPRFREAVVKTYDCPACGKSAFPSFVPAGNTYKLVVQCANADCNRVDGSLGPADFSQGVAVTVVNGEKQASLVGPGMNVTDRHPERRMSPVAPTSAPAAPAAMAVPNYTQSMVAAREMQRSRNIFEIMDDRVVALLAEEGECAARLIEVKARQASVRAERKQLEKMLRSGKRVMPEFDAGAPSQPESRVN